ncbi:MAG: ATP-binding cassette domain-containing protein [Tissierellia bacterium]|nr:ATP-binding cassette domain-containing protein [Tissierellia bacterium]
MIQIDNLTKKYRGQVKDQSILDDLSFSAKKGEKILIEGENGAGKTTFLKILGLQDRNFEGSYFIEGKKIGDRREREIARLRNEVFGFVFQDYHLLEEETAYNNILVPLIYSKKYKRKERRKRIDEIAALLEIESLLKQKVKRLSGGEKQKVGIARALVNGPKILLMDEPTNSLNLRMKEKIIDYTEKIMGSDSILIIVTHDLSVFDHSLYTIYRLRDGKLIEK